MSLFSYIKSRVAILDVIGEYTQLKKAGTYWKGHCPFHSEKNSFIYREPTSRNFLLLGCHAGGDVVTFIAQVEHLLRYRSSTSLG